VTRRVKAAGPTWTAQEKVGRKAFSRGVWAPQAVVDRVRAELAAERATPQYRQRREAGVRRRQRAEADYVEGFRQAVLDYLAFDARYTDLAQRSSGSWPCRRSRPGASGRPGGRKGVAAPCRPPLGFGVPGAVRRRGGREAVSGAG
jgi:hypothetical protein